MNTDVEAKYGKSFCCAPWNTVWTGSNGDVKFCCASTDVIGNIKNQTIDQIYNSAIAKKLRLQFLRGDQPEGCTTCWDKEKGGTVVGHARDLSNQQGKEVIDDSVANTLDDGTVLKQNLKFVDLIWSNKCNFSCIHCTPWLSSTISNNYKDVFSIWLNKDDRSTFEKYKEPANSDNQSKLDFILQNSNSLEEIHFNGGEPFLQPETFTLIEELLKHPNHKNIKLWFHTNGSIRTYKNVDVVDDYLTKWQGKCQIVMSHDHYGARGEYFRYGYNEEKWLENFWRFIDAGIETSIDTSVTLFNALTLKELFDWYDNTGILKHAYPSFNYVHSPEIWNFQNLGFNIESKAKLETSLIETGKKVVRPKMYKDWYLNLQNCLELLNHEYDYAIFKNSFIRAITALDRKRNTKFVEVYPELQYVYESLYDQSF
jgi:MoaA/NifB/PqqE/SkfB family radical SAM enzyme